MSQREVDEDDLAPDHVNAEIGVDANQHQALEEWPEDVGKRFHGLGAAALKRGKHASQYRVGHGEDIVLASPRR